MVLQSSRAGVPVIYCCVVVASNNLFALSHSLVGQEVEGRVKMGDSSSPCALTENVRWNSAGR